MKTKKFILFFCIMAFALASCATKKEVESIRDNLQEQIDGLKKSEIESILAELGRIDEALANLRSADEQLKSHIGAVESSVNALDSRLSSYADEFSAAVDGLKAADDTLRRHINELKEFTEKFKISADEFKEVTGDNFSDLRKYVDGTFSTLEQYNATCLAIAGIKDSIDSLDKAFGTRLATEIARLNSEMHDSVDSLDNALKAQLAADLAETEKRLTDSYTKVCDSLQSALDALTARVKVCEDNISSLQTELASRIQSIVFVPQYSDGKVALRYSVNNGRYYPDLTTTVYFYVRPASLTSVVASSLSSLKFTFVNTLTRASNAPALHDVPLSGVKVENGLLAVTLPPCDFDPGFFNGTTGVSACLTVSDGKCEVSSAFVPFFPDKFDYVLFEDPQFENYCVTNFDSNSDGKLSYSEAASAPVSISSDIAFTSLYGLDAFVNLQSVDFKNSRSYKHLSIPSLRNIKSLGLGDGTRLETFDYYDETVPSVKVKLSPGQKLVVNGVTCAVSHIGPDNTGNKVMCLTEALYWDRIGNINCHATSTDGWTNTENILAASYSAECAIACRAIGPRWYMASLSEVNEFHSWDHPDAATVLRNYRPISNGFWAWVSNEYPDDCTKAYNVFLADHYNHGFDSKKQYDFPAIAMKVL